MTTLEKQQQMYVDIIQLVGKIAKNGFGIDVINNPLFSGVFKQQLEKHHKTLVEFIEKYVPAVETPPVPTSSVQEVEQQEHTYNPQPVSALLASCPKIVSKQSEQAVTDNT